jgi:hypothetical protein
MAAFMASTVSRFRSAADATDRYQPDIGRARDSMSEVSGASYCRCQLA